MKTACSICLTYKHPPRPTTKFKNLGGLWQALEQILIISFLPLVLARLALASRKNYQSIRYCSGRRATVESICQYQDLLREPGADVLFLSYTNKLKELKRLDVIDISPIILSLYAMARLIKALSFLNENKACIPRVHLLYRMHQILIKIYRPKRVAFVSSVFFAPLVAACRESKVYSWEIAHAFMHIGNKKYDFTTESFRPILADVLLLNNFSSFAHPNCLMFFRKIIGKNDFDANSIPKLVEMKTALKDKIEVILIGQGDIVDEKLINLASRIEQLTPSVTIKFKLHPTGCFADHNYPEAHHTDIISSNKENVLIIGCYSNYCLELANLGLTVAVSLMGEKPEGIFDGTKIRYIL